MTDTDQEDRGIHQGSAAAGWHDPSGATSVGEATMRYFVDQLEQLMGRRCLVICREPWPGRRRFKCPSCKDTALILGKQWPEYTRAEVFAGWLGRTARAFVDAFKAAGAVLKVRDDDD